MNTEIKVIHFTLGDEGKEYLDKKLLKLNRLSMHLIDLLITLKKEKEGFEADATMNFRWSVSAHVKESASELNASIDKLIDAILAKIHKEKEKYQERR
jgi:putative sigma-54 modulation protein